MAAVPPPGAAPARRGRARAAPGAALAVALLALRARPARGGVDAVHPTMGLALGGSLVTVYGVRLFEDAEFSCHFGVQRVPALVQRGNGTDGGALVCDLPHQEAGFTVVEVSAKGFDKTDDRTDFLSFEDSRVLARAPVQGRARGGTLVHLAGENFQPSMDCFADAVKGTAHFHSSAYVTCELPPTPEEGATDVVYGSAALDVGFRAGRTVGYTQPVTLEPDLACDNVREWHGAEAGGTTVQARNRGAASLLAAMCKFGSTVVGGVVLPGGAVECTAPARAPGATALSLHATHQDGSRCPAGFRYVRRAEVVAVAPARATHAGGALELHFRDPPTPRAPFACLFRELDVPGAVAGRTAACPVPDLPPGFTEVRVALGAEKDVHASAQFMVEGASVLASATRDGMVFSASAVVFLNGGHFSPSSKVYERGAAHDARFVSTALVAHEVAGDTGIRDSRVGVALAGESPQSFVLIKKFHAAFRGLSPAAGDVGGGAQVALHDVDTGRAQKADAALACSVGTIFPVRLTAGNSETFICITPAHAAGTTSIGIGVHGQGLGAAHSFTYAEGAEVLDVEPAAGSHLTEVVVHGSNLPGGGHGHCLFGQIESAIVEAGAFRITCTLPKVNYGFVPVGVLPFSSVADPAYVQFLNLETLHVAGAWPKRVSAAPGTLVAVHGRHLHQDPTCGFPGAGHLVSSVLLTCEVVAPAGAAEVGLGTRTGDVAIALEVVDPPDVFVLAPGRGGAAGGTAVQVSGSGFADTQQAACSFGTVAPVPGRWISDGLFECTSPAGAVRSVPVRATGNGRDFSATHLDFRFVERPRVTRVAPGALFEGVGGPVHVRADAALRPGVGLCLASSHYCRTLSLTAPDAGSITIPSAEAGFSVLAFSEDSQSTWERGIHFEVATTPLFLAAWPDSGPLHGEVLVGIETAHAPRGLACALGAVAGATATVSSGLTVCSVAAADPSPATLSLSAPGGGGAVQGVTFLPYAPERVDELWPGEGTEEGGALVAVRGSNFASFQAVAVKLGTVTLRAAWVSDSTLRVTAPAARPGRVPLAVANNGATFSATGRAFRYNARFGLAAVEPGRREPLGDSRVVVHLEPWPLGGGPLSRGSVYGGRAVAGSTVSCRLGAGLLVEALPVGDGALGCDVPVLGEGFVSLEVALRGGQTTATGSQFQVHQAPEALAVYPARGSVEGGTVVYVEGFNFAGGLNVCRFGGGSTSSDAHAVGLAAATEVSSALLKCELPAFDTAQLDGDGAHHDAVALNALLTVALIEASADGAARPLPFEARNPVEVYNVHPRVSLHEGGMRTEVTGEGFVEEEMSCRFGTIGPIPARMLRQDVIECKSPARSDGEAYLTVSSNGGAEYTPEPEAYFY